MKNRGCSYPSRISPADEGLTLAASYSSRYPHSTELEWRRRIEAGLVLLNGMLPPLLEDPLPPSRRGREVEVINSPPTMPKPPRES